MGSDSVVARAAHGCDLHTFSAESVFDSEFELGRVAALRGGGKLGPVVERTEQGGYKRDKLQVAHQGAIKAAALRMTRSCDGLNLNLQSPSATSPHRSQGLVGLVSHGQ